MLGRLKKDPGRRSGFGELVRGAAQPTRGAEPSRGVSGQGAQVAMAARQDRERHACRERMPSSPSRQLVQNVGPHDPDEFRLGETTLQGRQRVNGITRSQSRLDARGNDPPPVGENARGGKPLPEIRHAGARLEHISGRDEQPDLIKPEPLARRFGHMNVSRVRGIEGAAKQADAHPPPVAEAGDRIVLQGRTWPVP